jgi:hypothetical protein
LKENNIHDETGILLCEAVRNNKKIRKVNIERNPISYKYIEEIEKSLVLNVGFYKKF